MKIVILALIYFTINLEPFDIEQIDNSVIIVCDNLYCKECLEDLSSLQHLWKLDYKTILITKSVKNKPSAMVLSKMFAAKIDYDDIYFKETKNRLGFDSFELLNYNIGYTPSMIIIRNGKTTSISYKEMFQDNPRDTNHLKQIILTKLENNNY